MVVRLEDCDICFNLKIFDDTYLGRDLLEYKKLFHFQFQNIVFRHKQGPDLNRFEFEF